MVTTLSKYWEQYDSEVYHPEVIDIVYWKLDPKEASEWARAIFNESWLLYYKDAINTRKDLLLKKIQEDIISNIYYNSATTIIQMDIDACQRELYSLLNHLILTKKPLSYCHKWYNDIEVNIPQKFITAINKPTLPWPLFDDIILITWNAVDHHYTHLENFISKHLEEFTKTAIWNKYPDIKRIKKIKKRYIDTGYLLKWWYFTLREDGSILVNESSGTFGSTSNITAKKIFTECFPNTRIETDITHGKMVRKIKKE